VDEFIVWLSPIYKSIFEQTVSILQEDYKPFQSHKRLVKDLKNEYNGIEKTVERNGMIWQI